MEVIVGNISEDLSQEKNLILNMPGKLENEAKIQSPYMFSRLKRSPIDSGMVPENCLLGKLLNGVNNRNYESIQLTIGRLKNLCIERRSDWHCHMILHQSSYS